MSNRQDTAPVLRKPTLHDIRSSLGLGVRDFMSAPLISFFYAGIFALAGMAMTALTYWTGQTFWLVLAVLGFPLIGTLACVGFYEISRRRMAGKAVHIGHITRFVWSLRTGQLPWLATIVVVILLFWFFLGHMIFALFLGLSPMTNVSTSLDVFFTGPGLMMMGVGTAVGAAFATLVFSISIHGIPMLIDRDIDFMTAMLTSMSAVAASLPIYLFWGALIGIATLIAILPFFLGLFITIPILGNTTWRLYERLSSDAPTPV